MVVTVLLRLPHQLFAVGAFFQFLGTFLVVQTFPNVFVALVPAFDHV
jgi:hypothetical protein